MIAFINSMLYFMIIIMIRGKVVGCICLLFILLLSVGMDKKKNRSLDIKFRRVKNLLIYLIFYGHTMHWTGNNSHIYNSIQLGSKLYINLVAAWYLLKKLMHC